MMQSFRNLMQKLYATGPAIDGIGFEPMPIRTQQEAKAHFKQGAPRVFAIELLAGRHLTVQDFVRVLRLHGIVTNHPLSRIKEAVKSLAKQDVVVRTCLEGKPAHKVWFIDVQEMEGEAVRRARTNLTHHP